MAADRARFTELVQRHRRELHVHCYRMLGSFDEAEDLVQETFLRAWRARGNFDGSPHGRAWLYRIATNACLDALRRRKSLVSLHSVADLPWLQPYPDRLLDEVAPPQDEPETAVVARESIELAFLAVIQLLPPRQRAVLITRDVLGWSAEEAARLLDMTVAAANSALQRARATVREHRPGGNAGERIVEPTSRERDLLQRYVHAHNRSDPEAILKLLRDDIRVTMPPQPVCLDGIDALIPLVARGFTSGEFAEWLLVPTAMNRMPAAANYLRRPGEREFQLCKLDVLRIDGGGITEITSFGQESLRALGLPDRP